MIKNNGTWRWICGALLIIGITIITALTTQVQANTKCIGEIFVHLEYIKEIVDNINLKLDDH